MKGRAKRCRGSGKATSAERGKAGGAERDDKSGVRNDPLGKVVRALFSELRLAGEIGAGAGAGAGRAGERVLRGEAGRAEHGTRVRFSLRLAGNRVQEVRYRAYGCPYTLACCEWLARRLGGAHLPRPSAQRPVAELLANAVGEPAQWAAALSIPQERLGRLLVIEDALRMALETEAPPAGRTA